MYHSSPLSHGGSPMPQLDERTGLIILAVGLILIFAGFVWFVIRGFRTGLRWGFVTLLPLLNVLFPIYHFRRAVGPLAVMLLGVCVGALPYAINAITGEQVRTDAVVEQKPVDGGLQEERITLTKA